MNLLRSLSAFVEYEYQGYGSIQFEDAIGTDYNFPQKATVNLNLIKTGLAWRF